MCHTLSFFFRSSRLLDPAVVLVPDSGNAWWMCGRAVALVCILFLSTSICSCDKVSSSLTASARVYFQVGSDSRVDVSIPEVYIVTVVILDLVVLDLVVLDLVASFSVPAHTLAFHSSSVPLFLPPRSFLCSPRPSFFFALDCFALHLYSTRKYSCAVTFHLWPPRI